mmetsp:Transcript_42488/g.107205  ORF Transcript_42488/g.107205 Transcript_42488/m.107205 type:complete len:233 (-) Transcript_42488:1625-2323(-)
MSLLCKLTNELQQAERRVVIHSRLVVGDELFGSLHSEDFLGRFNVRLAEAGRPHGLRGAHRESLFWLGRRKRVVGCACLSMHEVTPAIDRVATQQGGAAVGQGSGGLSALIVRQRQHRRRHVAPALHKLLLQHLQKHNVLPHAAPKHAQGRARVLHLFIQPTRLFAACGFCGGSAALRLRRCLFCGRVVCVRFQQLIHHTHQLAEFIVSEQVVDVIEGTPLHIHLRVGRGFL